MSDSIWDSIRPERPAHWIVLLLILASVVTLAFAGGQCSLRITSSPTTTTTQVTP